MGVSAVVGEVAAEAFTAADVLAGVATASEAVSSGAAIGDLVAAGAAQDLGGGVFMDTVTGGLLDASGAAIAPEAAVSSGLMSAQSAIDLGLTSATNLLSSGVPVSNLVSSGVLEELGNGAYLDAASGNLLGSSGNIITGPAAEGLQAGQISGMSIDPASGNIIQTMDDGSKIILDSTGAPIESVPAPSDPFNPSSLINPVTKQLGQTIANKALNALLAPATQALAGKTGFKPVGQGGLSMTNVPSATTSSGSGSSSSTGMNLTPGLTTSNPNYSLDIVSKSSPELYNTPLNPSLTAPQTQTPQGFAMGGYAMGGQYQEHNPSFYSEGGMENRYVKGDGDGTSDDVVAMLANGEFVIPADVVAALGNGSNDAGAHVLDQFLSVVRQDNHSNDPDELPPESKGPLAYLAQARKRA
jgi:hypothetical protein